MILGNLDSQLATDLASTFLRVDAGFANASLLGPQDSVAQPLTAAGGAIIVDAIFDGETAEDTGPVAWIADGGLDYRRRLIRIPSTGAHYRIETVIPRDDGKLIALLLRAI